MDAGGRRLHVSTKGPEKGKVWAGSTWSLPFDNPRQTQFIPFIFAACGGILSGTHGTFAYHSPNDTYVHNVNCFWVVRTDEEKVNKVTFVYEQISLVH